MVVIGQSGRIRAKVVEFVKKWLYSGKVVVFRQKLMYSGKLDVLSKNGCIREKILY